MATLAAILPIVNVNCIIYGTDGLVASVLSNINGNQTVRKGRVCGKRSTSERGQENCTNNKLPPPPKPKHKRKGKFHDGYHCGPCTVWIQTGSEDELKKYHTMTVYVIPVIKV